MPSLADRNNDCFMWIGTNHQNEQIMNLKDKESNELKSIISKAMIVKGKIVFDQISYDSLEDITNNRENLTDFKITTLNFLNSLKKITCDAFERDYGGPFIEDISISEQVPHSDNNEGHHDISGIMNYVASALAVAAIGIIAVVSIYKYCNKVGTSSPMLQAAGGSLESLATNYEFNSQNPEAGPEQPSSADSFIPGKVNQYADPTYAVPTHTQLHEDDDPPYAVPTHTQLHEDDDPPYAALAKPGEGYDPTGFVKFVFYEQV